MIKLFSGAALFAILCSGSAHAQATVTCDEATMTKMTSDMDAMNDPAMKTNKDMAMKYLDAAKTAMTAKNNEDCSAQLNMAKMSMTMKCDDASMAAMQSQMDAVTDPAMKANKDAAMKSMEMAKTSMKDNKTEECMTNMGAAMDAIHKKM
jgi:hypothetical protein